MPGQRVRSLSGKVSVNGCTFDADNGARIANVYTYTGIDPIAIEIGPLAVRWYGLMYLIGFVGGWALARYRAKQWGKPFKLEQVDDLLFYTAMGVILGGRVGYMLFYGWANLANDPFSMLRIWEGGMSFHGGLLGVLLAMWLLARKVGSTFFRVTDFMAPFVPIGLGAGRIGNFINGELWGKATDVPWAVIVNGTPLHPSNLYEAILEGPVLFTILWLFASRRPPVMAVSGMFLLCYGLFRFTVEFVRVPDAHIGYLAFEWLTMGQILSAPMIVCGALFIIIAYRRNVSPEAPVKRTVT